MSLIQRRIFISCGELSGDLLAADLIAALRKRTAIEAFGITGPNLRAQGVRPILDINDLNVMGLSEVLLKAHDIYLYIEKILTLLKQEKPDLIILVDFPGFHFRLAHALRTLNIPIVQYAAPKIWAWGKKRVIKLRQDFSMVLGILPFEAKFFLDHGVNYRYVGCPIVDRVEPYKKSLSRSINLEKGITLGIFPGSRRGEIKRILPSQLKVAQAIAEKIPVTNLLISVAKSLDPDFVDVILSGNLSEWDLPKSRLPDVLIEKEDSLKAMHGSDFALMASGTATLECAMIGTPQVVMYKMSPVTHAIAKQFVKIEHVSLVNLVAGDTVVQEWIQNYDPIEVGLSVVSLLKSPEQLKHMMDGYKDVGEKLKIDGRAADLAASNIIAEFW